MDNLLKNANENEYLLNERKITAEEFVDEIYPYFKEFYEGEVVKRGDKIIINLPNGQIFYINIAEKQKVTDGINHG